MEYIKYLFEERVMKCSRCFIVQSYACFYDGITQPKGKRSECIDCTKCSVRKYQEINKDRLNEYKKQYRQQNKAEVRDYNRQYKQQHKPQIREYIRNRRVNDVLYNITENLRKRINHAIKHHYKAAHTLELLGCDIDKFLSYLKYQCEQDNLDINSKNLHIDHIIPCSNFDLSIPEQQQLCFNYKNMRYCTASENLSKSDKIDEALIEKYTKMANDFELLFT